MAHFYGSVAGRDAPVSRLGTKQSGLSTYAASWQGAVKVKLWDENGQTIAHVFLASYQGEGVSHTLYLGPIGEFKPVNKP